MGERIEVLVRPAREQDTAGVMELTRTIWGGEDYVPEVWAEWLADTQGVLAVAETQGRVVGLVKVSILSPGEWWLHGLRTHPELQGHGIAAQLHDFALDFWQQHGSGVLRLATGSHRLPVQHLCDRTGFRKVGEFTFYEAPALSEAADSFTPLSAGEEADAASFALHSPAVELAFGLMDRSWEWVQVSTGQLAQAIEAGLAWWWKGRQGLLTVFEDFNSEKNLAILQVQLLAAGKDAIPALLLDFRRLAARQGKQWTAWTAPVQAELEPLLAQAGFEHTWDDSVFVYEKK